jgi:hypothetical protein
MKSRPVVNELPEPSASSVLRIPATLALRALLFRRVAPALRINRIILASQLQPILGNRFGRNSTILPNLVKFNFVIMTFIPLRLMSIVLRHIYICCLGV